MYQYLLGTFIMGSIWGLLFWARKDLRRRMLWSGLFYIAILSVGFIGYHLVYHDPVRSITPGYWAPPTLFGLGQKTGGYAIEDALFMFFAGGMAGALYEIVLRLKPGRVKTAKPTKQLAIVVGILCAGLLHSRFYISDMYLLIFFNLFGALCIVRQRTDLLRHCIFGGGLFLVAYAVQFLLFNLLFPNFIDNYYHLGATSGVMILGVPLEEYLYGVSFGMFWAPMYNYFHNLKDSTKKVFEADPEI